MIRRPCFFRRRGRVERVMIALVTAASLACTQSAGDHPPVYPVKGQVLHQGKPIAGGVVIYELDEGEAKGAATSDGRGPLRATGRIEPDGSFRLMAFGCAEALSSNSGCWDWLRPQSPLQSRW